MKNTLLFLLIGLTLFSCKKEEVQKPCNSNNTYQSQGNLLLLGVGETFECAYEYNLASTQLNNDSLPINIETVQGNMFDTTYWKFTPNPNILISNSTNGISFSSNSIDENDLENMSYSLPYDSTQFQLFGNNYNTDSEEIWAQVSKLKIVKSYRDSNPNSKIGIAHIPVFEFNEQLGYKIPVLKHFLFLVK